MMIFISGEKLDITEIVSEYSNDSIERKLLEQMSNSEEVYRYDNIAQFQFELDMRREIVFASVKLNGSGFRFAVFHKSECNEEYWERTGSGGFLLKRGASPSKAINDIFTNGEKYATECATAMVIVYYGALLEIYPEETFDRLFSSIYLMNWHQLAPLLRETGVPRPVKDILLGDRCYFRNPDVDPKVIELQGENVIVLPNNLYYGHGIGIRTANQIIQILNYNRFEGATQSAYFMENSAARPNFKKLYNAQINTPSRPAILQWRDFPQAISS